MATTKDEYVRYEHTFDENRKLHTKAIHTNTIEGHWSHFKRAISGTHVSISQQHLWKYVAEFNYRRNYRASHYGMFNRLVSAFALPRLAES